MKFSPFNYTRSFGQLGIKCLTFSCLSWACQHCTLFWNKYCDYSKLVKSGNITAGSRHYTFSWNHPANHALSHSSIKKWSKHRLHLVRDVLTMPLWTELKKAFKKCDFAKFYREMKGKGKPFFWNARTLKKRTLEERILSLGYHLFTQKLWKMLQYWGFQASTIIWAIFQASTVWVCVFLLERAKPKS